MSAFDPGAVDALLQEKWRGMKDALRAGDIEGALQFFEGGVRGAYRQQFTALRALLPRIADELGDIRYVTAIQDAVYYEMRALDNGVELSFQLLFEKDANGIWRIQHF